MVGGSQQGRLKRLSVEVEVERAGTGLNRASNCLWLWLKGKGGWVNKLVGGSWGGMESSEGLAGWIKKLGTPG